MRKVLILLLSISLITSCNNDKVNPDLVKKTDREKDDYKNRDDDGTKDKDKGDDRNMDDRNTDDRNTDDRNTDDRNTDDRTNEDQNTGGNWTDAQRTQFLNECVDAAAKGMEARQAKSYCSCMAGKIEEMYPDAREANKLTSEDMATKKMKKLIQGCLGY